MVQQIVIYCFSLVPPSCWTLPNDPRVALDLTHYWLTELMTGSGDSPTRTCPAEKLLSHFSFSSNTPGLESVFPPWYLCVYRLTCSHCQIIKYWSFVKPTGLSWKPTCSNIQSFEIWHFHWGKMRNNMHNFLVKKGTESTLTLSYKQIIHSPFFCPD